MSDAANWGSNFGTSRMDVYDEVLVGRMFEPWGHVLLDHAAVAEGDRVLDVACGPGSVTRLSAARVGPGGSVVGCDLSPAMLSIARGKSPLDGSGPISYHECPADALSVDDGSADAVVCQQGLQFFPDRVAALAEMRRAGRTGARVAVSVWCPIETCPPFAAMGDALGEILGADAAAGYRNGPWGLDDADELRGVMEAAGFAGVDVVEDQLEPELEGGVDQLLSTLLVAPVGAQVAALDPVRLGDLREALRLATEAWTDDGVIRSHTTSNTAIARV